MKARITVTVSRVVDLNHPSYHPDITITERLAMEIENATEYFDEFSDSDTVEWKTTGELIEE